MTGLYVHVPFCLKKCHYCNFVVSTSLDKGRFVNLLEKEAAHTREFFRATDFETAYLGGGTPSTLDRAEIQNLFSTLRKNFSLKDAAEVTLEANPKDVTTQKAKLWKKLGVNRISLGAQSFHDKTLKRMNRDHDAKTIEKAVRILKGENFGNLSLDLILSLPGEDWGDVKFSLEEAARLRPQHVSLYELTIEKKTVFASLHEKGKLPLPDEETQLAMLTLARDFFKKEGFIHYELLSYARPGFESKHNKIYWANGEYLGLGPGAFSYFGGRRFRNSESYEEYIDKIQKNDWSACEEESLDTQAKEIESFLLALRLSEGADAGRFASLIQKMKRGIETLEDQGLVSTDSKKIRLTPKGQFFAETVFAELSSVD